MPAANPPQSPQKTPPTKTSKPKSSLPIPRLTTTHALIILTSLSLLQITTIYFTASAHRREFQQSSSGPISQPAEYSLEQFKQYPDLTDKINTALPANSQVITLIEYLSQLAQNFSSNITLESNEPQTSPNASSPFIAFAYQGQLSYSSLTDLISIIEQPAYLIQITQLQIDTPTGLNQTVKYILKGRAFVAP